MKVLLDTHIVLWGLNESHRLKPAWRAAMADPDIDLFVSVVSLWEIAIKISVGKLVADPELPSLLTSGSGFQLLPITTEHVWRVRGLPFRHKDPFDRLMIAQAQAENMKIATDDSKFSEYDIEIFD